MLDHKQAVQLVKRHCWQCEEIQATITLKEVSCGTELNIVQEGVPDVIPAEACYLGWQESLTLLAKLVEAEIPD